MTILLYFQPNLELKVAVSKMKCYRKNNKKMAELLSLVRPLAFNGKYLKLTTILTTSSLSPSTKAAKSNFARKQDKTYSYSIPNEFTTNDQTRQNGGTTRAQKWETTTACCLQFGHQCVIYHNQHVNIETTGQQRY